MKKNGLTWIGCSGSLTLALLTGNSAQADTVREFVFTAPQEVEVSLAEDSSVGASKLLDCGCNGTDAQALEFTDTEGEHAIALFGCDCAGCRYLAQTRE